MNFWGTLRHQIVVFAVFFLSWECVGQQPAFSILGEDQFKGVQIYDIIQDNEQNYWFATNEGLFYYNFSSFEKVECNEAKSSSVFNFVKNEKGYIFCHNLNNQVFQIKDKQWKLFYELKKEEVGADISLAIGSDQELLVSSRNVIAINEAGKVVQTYVNRIKYVGPPFQLKDGRVIFHLGFSNEILSYKDGNFTKAKLNKQASVLKFVEFEGQIFAIDLNEKIVYPFNAKTNSLGISFENAMLTRSKSLRVYQTKDNLWFAGTLPGVFKVNGKLGAESEPLFYQDFFISDVFEDEEGNVLLGTFDRGVLLIPFLDVPDVLAAFENNPVSSVMVCPYNGLILGTSSGKLLHFDSSFTSLSSSGNRPIEAMACSENFLLFDDGMIQAYDFKKRKTIPILLASLKAACPVDQNTFYLGTNRGVYYLTIDASGKATVQLINQLALRIHQMAYEKEHEVLYVSTSEGVFVYRKNGQLEKINYHSKTIYPNAIQQINGKVYMLTKQDGILVYQNERNVDVILPKVEGKVVSLKKIQLFKETIIGNTAFGLFQFDFKGRLIRAINAHSGFSTKRIIDFTIFNDRLWVSHSGGFQMVDVTKSYHDKSALSIRFDKILVGSNEDFLHKKGRLKRNQHRIKFVFSVPTLRNRKMLHYYYQLSGADTNWTRLQYDQNEVTFNALSSGKYEFQVKAESGGKFSPTIKYAFVIPTPIYLTWWFLLITISSFLGIVYWFYRRQLSIQQKKSAQINELYASKLTAIQSQMNPHFIFNSLNSIQDLVLKKDIKHSYSYISTFSDLVRRTLSYSEKDFITCEQEVSLLELYLSLEQLRFKQELSYEITTNHIEDIMLPPMLIQPFIENSLVHGLLHKEGQKILKINLELVDERLLCIIEDNGVGREEAMRIRERQRGDHQSFSSEAIRKRFEILSQVFKGDFGFVYEDVFENGRVTGTRVILTIPYRRKY